MSLARSKAATAALVLVLPVVAIGTHLTCRDHLPARIPDPWDWSGGYLSSGGVDPDRFLVYQLPAWVAVAIALVSVAVSRGGSRSRLWMSTTVFLAAFVLVPYAKTEITSYGAPDVAAVGQPAWQTLLTFLVLSVYLRCLYAVLPVAPRPPATVVSSGLAFAPGVRVLWTGRATVPARLWVVLALVGGSVAVAVLSTSAAAAVLILAGCLAWGYLARVRINDDGVALCRLTGWPTRTLPLSTLTGARAVHVQRSEWSGRTELTDEECDPRSIVLRTGPTLVVESRDHLPLAVSVDHADEAAEVINALIARDRALAVGR